MAKMVLLISQSTMQEAMQLWLDQEFLKREIYVTQVKKDTNPVMDFPNTGVDHFVVEFEEVQEDGIATSGENNGNKRS